MQKTKRRFVLRGDLAGEVERGHGIVVKVDRAENLAKQLRHINLPPSSGRTDGMRLQQHSTCQGGLRISQPVSSGQTLADA